MKPEKATIADRVRISFALIAVALGASHAHGQAFNYLSEPVDVSPGGENAWVDVNVSAYVPAGATGVIVQAYNESSSDLEYGVRMNGSGDTWMEGLTLQEDTAPYLMVGLDAGRVFEVWQDNNVIITYLVGYTMDGVTFFQAAKDKSLSSTGSWQDVNISADTGGDTAIGAIFIMRSSTTSARSYAARKKGSGDDRYKDLRANMSTAVMIGVDASEIFQLRIENTALDTYLVGYVTSGAVFFDNAVLKSIGSSSYIDIDITSDVGSDDANGAIVEWTTSDDRDLVATRMNGQGHNVYEYSSHLFSFIGIDSGDVFEGKVQNTSCDFYLVGYTVATSSPTISSASSQTFGISDPPTAISDITVTDATPASITAANDIRIMIPAGFNMAWDATDTTASISGTGAGKVSSTVSYEASDKTLVVNVTTNFADGDAITISDLSFRNFAASAADNLELDIDNDATADATDDKTIQIGPSGTIYFVRKTGSDSANGLTPATAWLTIDKAANTMTAGDWVYVGAGTYNESVTPTNDGTASDPIRFVADTDGAQTGDAGTVEITSSSTGGVINIDGDDYQEFVGFKISAGYYGVQIRSCVGSVIQDCEIDGTIGGRKGIYVNGALQTATATITGCDVHDINQGSLSYGIEAWGSNSSATITDTLVHDTSGTGIIGRQSGTSVTIRRCQVYANAVDGMFLGDGTFTVANCLIYGNLTRGVRIFNAVASPTVDMWHCTVDNNPDGIFQQDGTSTIRNCVITNNTDDGFDRDGGTLNHSYNLVWGNGTNYEGTSAGTGEISSDPLYVGGGDYRLQNASQAIDAGTDGSSGTTVDLDNASRPADAGWDMGCYEDPQGTVYYVRKTGNDSSDGLTPATAWLTIDHAADTMNAAGDTVYVGAGTYDEPVTPSFSGTAASPIRFIADTDGSRTGDAGAVIITQAAGQVVWTTSDDYLEFDGFRITGGATFGMRVDTSTGIVISNCEIDGAGSHGIYLGSSHATITNCDLHGNGYRGIDFGGDSTAAVTDTLFHDNAEGIKDYTTGTAATATFRRCRFYDNTANGAALYYGDFTFINCLFTGNAGKGITTSTGSPTVTAWHCTIDDNGDEGIKQSGGTVTVRNCIITNNGFQGLALYSGTMDHRYNLLWGNSAPYGGTPAGTGEVLADPFYESSTDRNLQTGSPAINAGIDGTNQTTVDIDGGNRPLFGGWDMGCYEAIVLWKNYRSIGIDAATLYGAGTATIATGTRTVTFGGGATLPANIGQGDKLTIAVSDVFHVLERVSDTQVTVQETAGSTLTDQFYTIERAYNDFATWETARDGDLVGEDRREIAVAYDDGPFLPASTITIDDSTTDAGCYMMITVAEGQRHNGTMGTGVRIDAGGWSFDVIVIADEYTVIEWLELENFNGATTEGVYIDDSPPGDNALLRNLLIHNFPAGNAVNVRPGVSATIRNTIVYDGEQGLKTDGGTLTIENVTVQGMATNGVDANAASTVTIRNAIVVGSGSPDINLEGAITYFDYNMYDTLSGASAGVNDQLPPSSLTDLFVSTGSGSEDLHLQETGNDAVDNGLDLSTSFTGDIDEGGVRSGPWDIGADEWGTGASSRVKPRIIYWAEVEP